MLTQVFEVVLLKLAGLRKKIRICQRVFAVGISARLQKNLVMLIEEMLISAADCCWLQSMFSVSM